MPNTYPLGRLEQFDERSKRYRLGLLLRELTTSEPHSKCWPISHLMDQAIRLPEFLDWDPSSCTGFSRAHACNADPTDHHVSDAGAFAIYRRAKQLDEWPGEAHEGSSVLAAVQAAQELGYVESYWWALTYEEFVGSVSNVGPGVAGSMWLSDMFEPDERGFIHATGTPVGGHAYCIGGVILGLNAAVIYQSWGPVNMIADKAVRDLLISNGVPPALHPCIQLIDLDELWGLLEANGEFCVSMDTVPVAPLPPFEDKEGCNPLRRFLKKR